MSTEHGCGTTFYGWTDCPDGTRTATRWFVLFLFPIVPLERVRIVQSELPRDGFMGDGFATSYGDDFKIVENLPLDWRSIVFTYLNAYVLFPAVLLSPLIIFGSVVKLFQKQFAALPKQWQVLPIYLILIFYILVGIVIVRKTRGKSGV